MDFNGFKLLPMEGRLSGPAEQKAVGETLEAARILDCVPPAPEVLVEVGRRVPTGLTLAAAHNLWSESYFPNVQTPSRLPRQLLDIKTPDGLVYVTVSVIKKWTPGEGFTLWFRRLLPEPPVITGRPCNLGCPWRSSVVKTCGVSLDDTSRCHHP